MAIKFGSDGTLYCNTVKYNYKQARNLIANGCFCAESATTAPTAWTVSNCSTIGAQGQSGSTMALNFDYGAGVTAMSQQSMPTPIANHKYYGGCMWKTNSGFSAADNRFEWWVNDSYKMVFAYKSNTSGSWVKLSSIQSLSSVPSGNWIIRNFVVNGTTNSWCTKLMIVDLTDTFGAGNEPSKEWCDENILEWSKYYGIPDTERCTSANYNTIYTISGLGTPSIYNYLQQNNSSMPRDFIYAIPGDSSRAEGYINSTVSKSLTPSRKYYGFLDVYNSWSGATTSMDIYFPVAEPLLGQTPLVLHSDYNGGGNCKYWKRVSMLRDRSSFTSGSYPQRFDYNNQKSSNSINITNFGIISLYSFRSAARLFTQSYGGWADTSSYDTIYTKPFMDRRYGGYLMPIIHIPDPNKKQIKFNTNYDIVCNDIIPDPGNNKVWFDTNGRIHCKTIITDQVY